MSKRHVAAAVAGTVLLVVGFGIVRYAELAKTVQVWKFTHQQEELASIDPEEYMIGFLALAIGAGLIVYFVISLVGRRSGQA